MQIMPHSPPRKGQLLAGSGRGRGSSLPGIFFFRFYPLTRHFHCSWGGGGGDCNPSSPLSYPPLFDDLYDKVKFYSGLFD